MPTPSRSRRVFAACAALGLTGPAIAAPSAGDCGDARFEAEMLQRVNAFRAAPRSCGAKGRFAAAPPLRWSAPLAAAALGHTREMAARGELTHDSADGRSLSDRADAAGYGWRALGENVAAGQASIARVVDSWAHSDGHCANLMGPRFTELGVACVVQESSGRRWWTMDLGQPRR